MKNKKYLKSLIIRILISIILFLGVSIFVRLSDKNLLLYKNNVYDKTLKFTKIANLYNKYFGEILPKVDDKVISTSKTTNYDSVNTYKDGAVLNGVSAVYPFKSGIVVFIGEKDDYGNTVIIQGMDGVDYWYGNIENINVKLYDYVESDNIIGSAVDSKIYVIFMKDGNVLSYEDFI